MRATSRLLALILSCLTFTGLVFGKSPSSVTLTSSLNPSTYGNSMTFTATVAPSTATGTVTFKNGSTTLGTGTIASGIATYNTSTLPAGSDSITASYGGNSSYNSSISPALTQTVNQATPTITWGTPAAITYGKALSTTQLNAKASVAGTFAYSPASGTVLTAGMQTLSVTFTPTNTTDYMTATATVQLTVNQATSKITWAKPAAITYGTALSATQLDATASVAGTFVYSPAAGTTLAAGTQTLSVTFTPTDATDYATATSTASLTVNDAPLTVTAQNASRAYGAANPTFSDSITGFVNGDTQSVVSGTASLTSTATTTSAPGSYAITAAVGTLSAANYTFKTLVKGTLTVTKATPTITWAAPAAITYGTALSITQLDATASATGKFVYSPATGTVLAAGAQTLSVTFTPTSTTDYTTATATVGLIVNPVPTTATWATPAAITYGTALSATQLDATAPAGVPGTLVYSPPAGTVLGAGTQTLSVTFTPTNTNYAIATATVSLTVNRAPLTVTAQNVSRAYGAANPVFSDSISGFVNGDTQSMVSGTASLASTATTTSVVGSYPITAAVGTLSAANYAFATFVNATLTIAQATPTVALTSSANPSAYGSPVTFTATVSPSAAAGTVTFLDGSTTSGTGTISGGVATYSTSALTAGSHSITASYGGDANDSSSTSAVLTQTVNLTTQLNTSRYQHSATLLNNGPILVAGGVSCPAGSPCTYLNSAELYNSASGVSTNTGTLTTARSAPSVLLANGSVLITGGASCESGSCSSLSNAEIYNPASGTFASAGNMNVARDGHTMTLLSDGNVLIAGGETCSVSYGNSSQNHPSEKPLHRRAHLVYASFTPVTGSISCSAQDSAEIYDPEAGSFSYTSGSLNVARYNAAATRLVNGQVLIAGGSNEFNPLSSAELYDPSTGSFTQTSGALGTARSSPVETLLNNGLVLVSGGSTCEGPICPTKTAELYSSTTNAFQSTSGGMNVPRVGHTATLLTNGQVVLAGGNSSCQSSPCTTESSTETYDPASSTFSASQSMSAARTGHSATLLSNGSVLLVGGMASGATLASIELYQPTNFTPAGLVSIAVAPVSTSTGVGQLEQFTATGTFSDGSTSTLQSVVWSSSTPTVASINNAASSSGFAFGLGVGSTTITATAGTISGSATLSIQLPSIAAISPSSGAFGTQVTISGTNFGSEQGSGNVAIGGAVASVLSWSSSSIVVSLPGLANPGVGPVVVSTAAGTTSNSASFTVIPSIAGFSPSVGPVGTVVTVNGYNFGSSGMVTFDGLTAAILSWSPTNLSVVVPAGSSAGNVVVTSNSQSSNVAVFSVLPTPNIASLSATSGPVGTAVTISGTNFGPAQGASTVAFNGTIATPTSWSAGSVVVSVPAVATTGNVVITVNGVPSNAVSFAVVPTISNLSPTTGTVGTLVVIAGTGFGPSQGTEIVTFNGTAVTPISWSASSITTPVPPGATTGNVVVTTAGVSSNGVSFTVQSGGFVATTGQMGSARYAQAATRLASGQVLITGGMNSSGVLTAAELYAVTSQTFTPVSPMNVARWLHTSTLLNDGTVLIAGGSDLANKETLDSAEIYNPTTGAFTLLTSTLSTARVGHTATLLDNGQVLIVGGYDPDYGLIADAELYDPPSQSFIDLGDTNSPRYGHTTTMLQSGQVLIAGGETDPIPSGAYNTAELFSLANQTFTLVPAPLTTPREGHAAVLLNNGQVLLTGGDNPPNGSLNNAEIYDPPTNTFTLVASPMTVARTSHVVTLLNGGKVLVAGGATDSNTGSAALNAAELYDPTTQSFVAVGNMTSVREHQTASLLNDGTVFEAGGTDGTNVFNTAEIYISSRLNGLSSIAITPSATSIGTGAQQSFIAVGRFSDDSTQTLASVLWSSSSPATAPISGDGTNPGVAVGTAQGTTSISAGAAGTNGSATLTVTTPTLVSITLGPQDPTIPVGATQQFTATGVYSDGSTQDLTSTATWSSPPNVVIAINSAGLAAGLFPGTAPIQANSGSVYASTTVTVGSPAIVSIAVSPSAATVAQGSSQQYLAIGTYSDGSTQNVTTLLAWSSGTPTVAAVGSAGLAAGVSQGTATLTGTYENISASAVLTVTSPTLVSVTVLPNAASLSVGATQQLTATGRYTDGSTQNLTASSTWVSSNSSVIGANSTGLATASVTGNATITATFGSFSGSAALVVTTGTAQANLNTSRYQHNATILNNGQILAAGGINCSSAGSCTYLNSAELYNPDTSAFTTTGPMATARSAPSVLLSNGKVLIAGGYNCGSSGSCSSLISAEIYDPVTGTFSSAGSMTVARSSHTMTVLANGVVLIAGGQNCTSATSCTTLSSAEIYDPNAGTFTPALDNMSAARFGASAVLLNSGLVLIVGGFDGTNLPAAVEIYNPVGSYFVGGNPSLNVPRFDASVTLLNTGQALVAGGSTCALPGCPTNAGEIYDPVANTFTLVAGGMTIPRLSHSANLLTDGQVFVAGGYSSCASTCTEEASTEVFDPVAGVFSASQSVAKAVAGHTGTVVANGNVLLIGGINAGLTLSADEWYQPTSFTPAGLVSVTVAPATVYLPVGQSQQFVATGTFTGGSTQTLQSVIWNSSNPSVASISNSPGNAGIVNALVTGTTTLTATAGDMGGSATLSAAGLVSLTIAPANPSVIIGSGQQFTASGTFSDNSVQDLTGSVTWSTSNVTTLLIASTGLPGFALGANAGTATVTATLGGTQGTTSVTVLASSAPPTIPSITSVSPSTGAAGTPVTISGSGFGSAQGNGNIWLGSTLGTVLSWSNTQIVAAVAAISTSGIAQVQQNGLSSNTVPFNVSTAAISSISPTSGVPGTQVTISGSGFGATQGSGQVWLGTTNSTVQSWSDTQVVAIVAIGAMSGNAEVLQNGVMSNSVPFAINSLRVDSVTPNSGGPGTAVTITGTGFGSSQGDGEAWLGSTNGQVIAWSNTEIVASVGSSAVSGVVKVEQNGVWSNTLTFTVPGGFGSSGSSGSVTIVPNAVAMLIDQTTSLEAVDANGMPVSGLTWTSSNPSVVSLSTDDPPILTALAAGNATITAGNASADVTVLAGSSFPIGTVLWSYPGPNPSSGTTVTQLVPAVPSSTGTSDVFSLQSDCTVQALTSTGTLAWKINIGTYANSIGNTVCNNFIADFQGGLVVYNPQSIMEINGAGVANLPYTVTNSNDTLSTPVAHTDGTIFTVYTQNSPNTVSVVGIDPATGNQLFNVPMTQTKSVASCTGNNCSPGSNSNTLSPPGVLTPLMIAGDGYAYVTYEYSQVIGASTDNDYPCDPATISPYATSCNNVFNTFTSDTKMYLTLFRVGSSGSSANIQVQQWEETTEGSGSVTYAEICPPFPAYGCYSYGTSGPAPGQTSGGGALPSLTVPTPITNADTGVLLSWEADLSCSYCSSSPGSVFGLATTSGSNPGSSTTFNIPGQASPVVPILQAQDGTFFGTVGTGPQPGQVTQLNMISFSSSSGRVFFSIPNDSPKIATADGGVIGTSGISYDSNGNVTAQAGSLPTLSWTQNAYTDGPVNQVATNIVNVANSFTGIADGNASGNGTATQPAAPDVQQSIAQIALSKVGSKDWLDTQGSNKCNLFVNAVLDQANANPPVSPSSGLRQRLKYYLDLADTPAYPALAGDWANPGTVLKCWKTVTVNPGNPPLAPGTLPPDISIPGDVIAEAIKYSDATGHVGIIVGPRQTVSADSAAPCFPPNGPAGIIDVSDYGFRPANWIDPFKDSLTGQPCRTHGKEVNAVVKRFVCQ